MRSYVWAIVIVAAAAAPVYAQVNFVDISTDGVLQPTVADSGWAAGLCAADYDDDGYVDLFIPNGVGVASQIYHNLGNGHFEEVSAALGVVSMQSDVGGLWFDYDGDHDLDLLITRISENFPFTLYRQNSPTAFENVTAEAGLDVAQSPIWNSQYGLFRGGSCAGDINNDGYLDLCTTIWNGVARLFLNNRDGTFTEISASSGISSIPRRFWQAVMSDFNGDGWLDIYMAVDFRENLLWINQRDNTFVEMAASAGLDNDMNDMGVTLGDYDNDGDLDIYITNIFQSASTKHNVLYRNDSVGASLSYVDVSTNSAVEYGGWAWGTSFADVDRDGWSDLLVANGWSVALYEQPTFYYVNTGYSPFVFANETVASGLGGARWGSGLAAFDYDRDGDLDFAEMSMDDTARFMMNEPTGGAATNHYLTVRPRMLGPNHRAIGAIVRVQAGGVSMMRLISAGISGISQEPAEAFFGLGSSTYADSVTVEWPDGTQTVVSNVAADQMVTVTHGGFGDLDADGDVDLTDYASFRDCMTGPGDGTIIYLSGCRAADIDGDGDVDLTDFAVVAANFTG
ncbi:MAG: VCBS repeat-containing protein [Phycisphaerales bacterium]|nr:VCBS repeat-containing protein [Phycisphaerales bacterium]